MKQVSALSAITLAILLPTTTLAAEQSQQLSDEEIEKITVVSRTLNLYRNGATNTGKLAVDPLNS